MYAHNLKSLVEMKLVTPWITMGGLSSIERVYTNPFVWILSSENEQPSGIVGVWYDESLWVDTNLWYD